MVSLLLQGISIVALVYNPILVVLLLLPFVFPLMAGSILKWPLLGVYLIIFSIFLGPLSPIQLGQKTPNLFYADMAIFLVLFILFLRQISDPADRLQFFIGKSGLILIPFIVFSFFTLLISKDPLRGLGILRNYCIAVIILSLVISCIRSPKHIRSMTYAFTLWGIVLSIMAIGSVFMQSGLNLLERVSLSWGRANYIATFPVMMIPIILAPILSSSISKGKFYMIASILLLIITLLFTLSRGGAIALLVVLMILTIKYMRVKSLPYLILFLSIVFLLVYFSPLGRLLIYRFESLSRSPSALVRIIRWKRTWEIFKDNPIVGVGIGNLSYYLPYMPQFAKAHNLFLMLLSETGLIGFCLFISMMIYIIRIQIINCIEIKDSFQNSLSWGIFAATVGVLVHSMVEPIFQAYQFSLIFWSLVGVSTRQYWWRKEI